MFGVLDSCRYAAMRVVDERILYRNDFEYYFESCDCVSGWSIERGGVNCGFQDECAKPCPFYSLLIKIPG